MLTEKEIIEIFKKTGVMNKGHFLLTSGKHSDTYMQVSRIFEHPEYAEMLCKELKGKFDVTPDIVIGPAIGAIQMSYETARQLGALCYFAEREDGKMTLRRGFHIEKGQKVLVVEDVITTGGTVKEVIELVNALGGEVVGVASIVDRSKGQVSFGVPFRAVYSAVIKSWEADECELCKQGLPITKPGSRKVK